MNFPEELKYTKDHEWIKVDGTTATIGITDYAQGELGDIVFVEVDTVDEDLDKEEVFGTIEAVKTVSDLFMPVGGKVIEFNEGLEDSPESINNGAYDAWIVKVEIADTSELEELLDAGAYKELVGA